MKILVKANNWLGDAVMSIPTLRSLRAMHPRARIAILSKRSFADLYEGVAELDEILSYERTGGAGRLAGGVKLARTLKERKFDAAVILPRSFSSAMLAFTARIPRRIGYAGDGRTALLTDTVRRDADLQKRHRVHYFHNLLTALGKPPAVRAPKLVIPDEARAQAREILPRGKPVVAVNPGATYGRAKQWFPDRFAAVARRLKAGIVTVGGPSDHAVAEEVLEAAGGGVQLAGRTKILELAAVLEAADLLITNDTGPMHVADAVGTPVVAVYGPTDPVTTPPFGRRHTIVRREMECSPCLKRECPLKHHDCMKRITVDEVYKASAAWLK
ncbi:MAG: lipopolysaccharide heptosyltransferase II [Planctomycetota bacterium]|jgi:heptosyltransferase-2